MNCNDYLKMLATLPVDDLGYGDAREHAANCRDCDRVTRVVAERERNLQVAFDNLYSSVPAAQNVTYALEASRRRRVVRYYEFALGIALAASLLFFVISRRAPSPAGMISETFRLQCLSPSQAAEVLRPYLTPSSQVLTSPRLELALITVRATPEVMQKAKLALDHYDNPAQTTCAARVIVPKAR
jgi:hypothetical protein